MTWDVVAVRVMVLPWEERRRRYQVYEQRRADQAANAWRPTLIYRSTPQRAEEAAAAYLRGPQQIGQDLRAEPRP